jgi:hypothetical protein
VKERDEAGCLERTVEGCERRIVREEVLVLGVELDAAEPGSGDSRDVPRGIG